MSTDAASAIDDCLAKAHALLAELPASEALTHALDAADRARLAWIERQVAVLVSKLQAVQTDLECGLSLTEMGLFDPTELRDLVDDTHAQLRQLKAQAMTLVRGRMR